MPSPVSYPALRINGNEYQFRFTRSSHLLLESWGYELSAAKRIPALAWAAAMAGTVDSQGVYRSSAFRNQTDFTDQIALEDDLTVIYAAVTEALKKAAPKATLTLVPSPASDSSSTEKAAGS